MEWHETDYPDWPDAGKEIEMEGGPTGMLVVVDQTPGPDEAPLWGIEVNGKIEQFDYLKRWRFVTHNVEVNGDITPADAAFTSTDVLGISLALLWQPVPDTLPPDPYGGWFSPMVWLALSDGRVLTGQCLHKDDDAEYDAPVHDWFVVNPDDGISQALNCFGDDLSVIAWMPLAVPDHPRTANGRLLIPNAPAQGPSGGLGNTHFGEKMELPILMNHEHDKPIGVVREQDGSLFVEFLADMKITKDACFEIFGGAGLQVLEATEEVGAQSRAGEAGANLSGGLGRCDWQKKCLAIGFEYWRAPDAHGVTCTIEQATELLQDLLGVEVEIERPNIEHSRRPQGVRVDGPVGPHTQEE